MKYSGDVTKILRGPFILKHPINWNAVETLCDFLFLSLVLLVAAIAFDIERFWRRMKARCKNNE